MAAERGGSAERWGVKRPASCLRGMRTQQDDKTIGSFIPVINGNGCAFGPQ